MNICQFRALSTPDPDVQLLRDKAVELHAARVEQRRRNLECLTADGLIALGRMYLPQGNQYLADAILTEFCRRLEQPLDETSIDIVRSSSARSMEAVHPTEPATVP